MIDRMFIQEEKTTLALDKQLAKEKPGWICLVEGYRGIRTPLLFQLRLEDAFQQDVSKGRIETCWLQKVPVSDPLLLPP